jgi:hypothetical protein
MSDNCLSALSAANVCHARPCCGGRTIIIETFQRGSSPRYCRAASTAVVRIDTS